MNIDELKGKIQDVLAEHPTLNPNGFGGYGNNPPPEPSESLDYFLSEKGLNEIRASLEWLKGIGRIKTVNRRYTSYRYKHLVEQRVGAYCQGYCSNGSFIVAAILSGVIITPDNHERLNVYCNFSKASLEREGKAVNEGKTLRLPQWMRSQNDSQDLPSEEESQQETVNRPPFQHLKRSIPESTHWIRCTTEHGNINIVAEGFGSHSNSQDSQDGVHYYIIITHKLCPNQEIQISIKTLDHPVAKPRLSAITQEQTGYLMELFRHLDLIMNSPKLYWQKLFTSKATVELYNREDNILFSFEQPDTIV